MTQQQTRHDPVDAADDGGGIALLELISSLKARWRLLLIAPVALGLAALGGTYLLVPGFTARTTLLPPQQQQNAAASALASLGSLAGLAGGAGTRNSADQYIGLMQSTTVSDRIINRFELQKIYDLKLRSSTRRALAGNVRILAGKKDGLISVEVDDADPQRAADIANRYVAELRQMTSELAVTEAQQRRVFLEGQLKQSQEKLIAAQLALQSSGFSAAALKAEPRATAEAYATLKAEVTATEVKLQTMRAYLSDRAAEVQQAQSTLAALRGQLARLEESRGGTTAPADSDYVGKYREFKYQETLFELFARQFEAAKVDESREGALIQVVDIAMAPDHKSSPKRGLIAASVSVLVFLGLLITLSFRKVWQSSRANAGAN